MFLHFAVTFVLRSLLDNDYMNKPLSSLYSVDEQESRRINYSLLLLIWKMKFISNGFAAVGNGMFLRDCWFKLYVFTHREVKNREISTLTIDQHEEILKSLTRDIPSTASSNCPPTTTPFPPLWSSNPSASSLFLHLFRSILPRLPKAPSDRFEYYLNAESLSKLLVLNGSHRVVTE